MGGKEKRTEAGRVNGEAKCVDGRERNVEEGMAVDDHGRKRKKKEGNGTEERAERKNRDGWEWAGEEKEKDGKRKGTGTSACRTQTKFIIFLC